MKIKLLRTFGLVLCFVVIALSLKAQVTSQTQYFVPKPFPRSPTSTALEKYGTYQVNEFTGVPDISIPLYTIEAGGIKVPITLSYHASGNKVTDVASWVGLGWSVSAGGQITRKALGLPDDGNNGYLYGNMKLPGTYSQSNENDLIYIENASTNKYDSKPDIYSYDFPGHSGKFFFDGSSGTSYIPRMIPYSPVKVQYTIGTHFNLTDEHGNRYLYGDAATEMTTTTSSGSPGITNASAWKIESMISQNRRDTISFSYNSQSVVYPSADGEIYTVIDNVNNFHNNYYTASYTAPVTTPGNANVTAEMLPKQINFKNGMVVFTLDGTKRSDINIGSGGSVYGLNNIQVYKYNYATKGMELQKTIKFCKTYFNATSGTMRLRLDSIQVLDKAGSTIQHYRFDYNTAISLPDYTSKMQDYWGYFNNVNNSQLTPQMSIPYLPNVTSTLSYVTIGSDHANGRNCDSNYMQAFMLTGIHYPSGGYSTFTYQTNQYTDNGVLKLAGGLRIKTISSYDGINPTPVVKTYVYNSARANFNLDYCYFSTSQGHKDWETIGGSITPTVAATATVRTFYSSPHCDLEGYDGSTVVYPSVTEYIGTPGNNAGRTDYMFRDQQDQLSSASRSGSLIYISYFFARGQLLTKNEYLHKSDGTYQLVKTTSNAYTAFYPLTDYTNVGLNIVKNFYNEGSTDAFGNSTAGNPMYLNGMGDDTQNGVYSINYYDIVSDDNYLTGTTTNIYDMNDPTKYTTSTVSYKYDNITHQQVTRTYHADSKGNTIVSRSKYPADYPAGNVVIDSMVNRNMQAEAIEKYDTVKNVATGINAITSAQLNQYKTGILVNTIVPSKISTLSVGQPLTNFVPSTVTSGSLTSDSRYVQVISFDQYDGQNNIIQYTPRNATPTSIIWNYQSEQPVAQVKNATTIYGSTTQVAYTSFEADGKGNWSYTGTPVFNAAAPNGAMVYPLSSGSVSLSIALDNTKTYVLSYWSNNGAATVYAGSYLTGSPLTTVNSWTYYEYTVPAGAANVTLSGTTTIDELRLYPSNAQMTTYAYDPSGVRSISDTKGKNDYFEYDFAQRLKNIKDLTGNIISNYGYHMYDQTVSSQAQSATFTRNNCPPNTTPGSLIYTVPANKYYSSTLASANADAIYDMNINGQISANANCGCPVIMVSFTLSNSTGLSGYQATFSGISTPYNFPASGSTVVQVPQGTYAIVSVNPVGSNNHTFSLTGQTSIVGHLATFNNISVTTGSNLTLSVQ